MRVVSFCILFWNRRVKKGHMNVVSRTCFLSKGPLYDSSIVPINGCYNLDKRKAQMRPLLGSYFALESMRDVLWYL